MVGFWLAVITVEGTHHILHKRSPLLVVVKGRPVLKGPYWKGGGASNVMLYFFFHGANREPSTLWRILGKIIRKFFKKIDNIISKIWVSEFCKYYSLFRFVRVHGLNEILVLLLSRKKIWFLDDSTKICHSGAVLRKQALWLEFHNFFQQLFGLSLMSVK